MHEQYRIKKSSLSGTYFIPPSKSHTLRSILFASLAKGESLIRDYLVSPDVFCMIEACKLLGASITVNSKELLIQGVDGMPKTPIQPIDCGNSGQVLRFIGAIAALTSSGARFIGDESIQKRRPITPLIDALNQLGAKCSFNGAFEVLGPIRPGVAELDGEDSQPISALLVALSFLKGKSQIYVRNPGERPWVAFTLSWLKRFGIVVEHDEYKHYKISGNAIIHGFTYRPPADFSSAAFFLVAALITQSEITLDNLDMGDFQGDKAIVALLQQMGAKIEISEKMIVRPSGVLKGIKIDANGIIDAVPVLAVLGCFCSGEMEITGAKIARMKESDRLFAMATELKKMGANIELKEDGLLIRESRLVGASVDSHLDHRVAMALTVAGMGSLGETVVDRVECVKKSFPDFFLQLEKNFAKSKKT